MEKRIPIHDFIEADSIPVKVVKLNQARNGEIPEAHRHNYYEILVFKSGGGEHMIDFHGFPIHDHSIHFVSAGQVHALKRTSKAAGYVVIFSKEFITLNLNDKYILSDFPAFNKSVPPSLVLGKKQFPEFEALVLTMVSEYSKNVPFKENILSSYISILLHKCKALLLNSAEYKRTDAVSQELLQRFNNLVELNFVEFHKVNEYADLLNVTPNHLSETIKKVTGKTAGEIIHERLILEAKRLLLHSSITAKELAYTLNFNDPSYFSRFFKANTALSPETFRKQIREKYQH